MDDEKLILLVRERDEIYNRSNPLFKYVDKKQEAWTDIANELQTTAEDCMRRWTNLRDRFTRECRMERTSDADRTIIWPFFEMMQFIKPFVCSRPVRGSIFTRTKIHTPNVRHTPTFAPIRKRSLPPASPLPSSPPPISPSSSPSPSPSISASPTAPTMECENFNQILDDPLIESPIPPKNTIITNPEVNKSFCEAVEALKKACALNEVKYANPAVYAFGEMIVSTICSMNRRNQLKVMQQVTDTVMKVKLEEDELLQVSYSTL